MKKATTNKTMNRTPIEIDATKLNHAPWNPRPKIEAADVKELASSIKTSGLIHRLGVWRNAKGKYVVIAGNRRLEACKAAGMKKIPCDLIECDEATAREITITENLQREDCDVFMQADNLKELKEQGRTIEEIASAIGKGVTWVQRRLQIVNLAPEYREKIAKGEVTFTTDALEKISRYSPQLQVAALEEMYFRDDETTAWRDIKRHFENATCDLMNARFDTSECEKCAANTASQPNLFDYGDGLTWKKGSGTCGSCTNKECFVKKTMAAFEAEKEKLEKKYGTMKTLRGEWDIPGNATARPNKKNKTPYIVKENYGNQIPRIMWGEEMVKPVKEPKVRLTKEEREAKKAEEEQVRLVRDAKEHVGLLIDESAVRALKAYREILDDLTEADMMDDRCLEALLRAAEAEEEADKRQRAEEPVPGGTDDAQGEGN